jgi:hypothetical protein
MFEYFCRSFTWRGHVVDAFSAECEILLAHLHKEQADTLILRADGMHRTSQQLTAQTRIRAVILLSRIEFPDETS